MYKNSPVNGRTFGYGVSSPPRLNLLRIEETISAAHLRLVRVLIENRSWEKILSVYDREETFFYLDPPYFEAPVYKHNFYQLSDFEKMNSILQGIQGKFLLSINDRPEIREVFAGFSMKAVTLPYSTGRQKTTGRELLVANYEI